ncbi:MAG: ribosome-associated translation inhibitor RaiA, partial [Chloroflexota bacterium]
MSLIIKAKNLKISEDTKAYIEKKTDKFNRFLAQIEETRVDVSSQKVKNSQERIIVEITVRAARKILRAEEKSGDLHAAIDIA